MKHEHIAVVVPAHNEEADIDACLSALRVAIARLPESIRTRIIVVLDACADGTLQKVQAAKIDYLTCEARCVGRARALGVDKALSLGATWIATTDADSEVDADWLVRQFDEEADMVCGVVTVKSWAGFSDAARKAYLAHYQDKMNHRHIHGASLAFSAQAYAATQGFLPLAAHEDVALVREFEAAGRKILWSNAVRVTTSSRLEGRASEGFAHFLRHL